MKIHRFYVPEFAPQGGQFIAQNPELIHQLTKVLRMKTDDNLQVFDGKGGQWNVAIDDMNKKSLTLKVISQDVARPAPKISLRVYIPLIKKDRLEWVIEKLTEIGVESIVFVTTARTLEKNVNWLRINKIIVEASEQSGRTTLPIVEREIVQLADLLSKADEWKADYFCIANFAGEAVRSALANVKEGKVALLIGPEGGFAPGEVEELNKSSNGNPKVVEISLGENVLRAETAAIVSSGIILSN